MLWPATIPRARDEAGLAGKTWLNVYGATDPVAGHLDSFNRVGDVEAVFRPRNLGYAASAVPLLSHLRYLTPAKEGTSAEAAETFGVRLAQWVLGLNEDIKEGSGARWRAEHARPA